MDTFEICAQFDCDPATLYRAWTEPALHAAFTGGGASGQPAVGAAFTAWDGYISGTWLALVDGQSFAQAWRTEEFAQGDIDSRVEVSLRAAGDGTELTLHHSNIPAGEGDRYRQGWVEFYFDPLAQWLANGGPA